MVKIFVVPSEHVRTESQACMMDSYHARSISLGTHSVICDRSSQPRIVAAKRVSYGQESHSQSTPASPTPLVRCGAIPCLWRIPKSSGDWSLVQASTVRPPAVRIEAY